MLHSLGALGMLSAPHTNIGNVCLSVCLSAERGAASLSQRR